MTKYVAISTVGDSVFPVAVARHADRALALAAECLSEHGLHDDAAIMARHLSVMADGELRRRYPTTEALSLLIPIDACVCDRTYC